ncbi:MAG: hypothetical protein PVH61_21465 [Candidatus Aminicenantes bacterium]|jgi:hypothetical protein
MRTLNTGKNQGKVRLEEKSAEMKSVNDRLWFNIDADVNDIRITHFTDRDKLQEETLRQSCCPVMA